MWKRVNQLEEFVLVEGQKRSAIEPSQLGSFFTSFQLLHKPTTGELCPLCKIKLEDEHVYYADSDFLILDTREKKGHKARIMAVARRHGVQHREESLNRAIKQLVIVGKELFSADFILLSDKFSSVMCHWHIVASDLDADAADYRQIIETPFILIASKNNNSKSR